MFNLGVIVAVHMAKQGEDCKRLSNWLSDRLEEDPLIFSEVMHSLACYNPTFSYWQLVGEVKDLYESPVHWEKIKQLAEFKKRRVQ